MFSTLPADTLAAAIAPVAGRCWALAWAVDIQSGLLHHDDVDADDLYDRWVRRATGDGIAVNRMQWLERGFLPALADRLVLDEWSYFLGFDPFKVSADMLAAYLNHHLNPQPLLFEAIARFDLLYLMRVDEGWWEAYAANGDVLRQLEEGWGGNIVDSDRWDGRTVINPGTDPAT